MSLTDAVINFQLLRHKVLSKGQKVTFETVKIAARDELTESLTQWLGEGVGPLGAAALHAGQGRIFDSATLFALATFYAEFESRWDAMEILDGLSRDNHSKWIAKA